MKKIGNILHTNELVNHKKVDFINYYENIMINEIDNDLPTLIVGWSNVKINNLENISILNKTIHKNQLYWEFDFEEYKQQHVDGVSEFSRLLPDYYFRSRYNYSIIDPIFYRIYTVDGIVCDILNNYIEKAYLNNNMLYVLSNNNIYGLDLETFNFFSLPSKEIISIFENKSESFINDENGEIFNSYFKYFKGYKFTKRYLISLL